MGADVWARLNTVLTSIERERWLREFERGEREVKLQDDGTIYTQLTPRQDVENKDKTMQLDD